MTRNANLVAAFLAILSIFGSAPLPARAGEAKLNVYVNPLRYESRIPRLAVGDKAPPLTVERCMKGGPINGFSPCTVYVV